LVQFSPVRSRAYRASKLGTVLFTTELARRIEGSNVTAVSVSPGPAKTNFGGGGPSGLMGVLTTVLKRTPLLKSPERAAESIAWAATAPELTASPGAVYLRHKQLTLKGAATDRALASRVWALSEKQTGIHPAHSNVAAVAAANRVKS
jgi:NAD(P)-dependent dehydrogenase (short-subunit alcohol dehydrogenase family)